jgi:hypothetical protein
MVFGLPDQAELEQKVQREHLCLPHDCLIRLRHGVRLPDQAELEQKVQRERALAEAEGRAREARENEDINRRTLTLRLEEERKKLVEAINATFGCGPGIFTPKQALALQGHQRHHWVRTADFCT